MTVLCGGPAAHCILYYNPVSSGKRKGGEGAAGRGRLGVLPAGARARLLEIPAHVPAPVRRLPIARFADAGSHARGGTPPRPAHGGKHPC